MIRFANELSVTFSDQSNKSILRDVRTISFYDADSLNKLLHLDNAGVHAVLCGCSLDDLRHNHFEGHSWLVD